MTEPTNKIDILRRAVASVYHVSGTDLEYVLEAVVANLVALNIVIPRHVTASEWEEIEDRASRIRALADNVSWSELSSVAFALREGARQQDADAVAASHKELRQILARLTGVSQSPADTRRVYNG
jgi:hypothetical protein